MTGCRIVFALILISLQAHAYHVVIDPGHGGIDTGAVHGEAKESVLVLNVANKLRALLEKKSTIKVSMTRTTNQNISLQERVNIAEKAKADLFVSLHANAAPESRARGVEFFFQNNLPADEDSLFLANQENQIVANLDYQDKNIDADEPSKKGDIAAILDDLQRQNRMFSSLKLSKILNKSFASEPQSTTSAIKQAPFFVVSKTSMPSVLIEVGFLTNPQEVRKLMSQEYQNEVAEKIFLAIQKYREKNESNENKVLK